MILIGTEQSISQARDTRDFQIILSQMARAINQLSDLLNGVQSSASVSSSTTDVTVTGSIVRSGIVTGTVQTGTVVTFDLPFTDTDYSVVVRGYEDANPQVNVNVSVVKTATDITLYPDEDSVTVEWTAQETAVMVSGLESNANISGVTVTFPNPFADTGYVVMVRGYDHSTPTMAVNITVSKFTDHMVLYPDASATDIEWTAQVATQ